MSGDGPIHCDNCHVELPPGYWQATDFIRCRRCGEPVSVVVFPAILEGPARADSGAQRISEEDASCFFHPERQAQRACDHCGRFVCALCDLDFGDHHVCPACLDAAEENRDIPVDIERKRVCYEDVAFALALIPLIFGFCLWWIWVVTAPAAIFTALWFWRRPSKIASRGIAKRLGAILIAAAQLVGWVVVLTSMWRGFFPYELD